MRNKKMQSFRLDPLALIQLKELSQMIEQSQSSIIEWLIDSLYASSHASKEGRFTDKKYFERMLNSCHEQSEFVYKSEMSKMYREAEE